MRKLLIATLAGLTFCFAAGDFTPSAQAETLRQAYRRAARTNYNYNRWHNTYYGAPGFYAGTVYYGGYAPGYYYTPPVYRYSYSYPSYYSYPGYGYSTGYRYSYPSYGYYNYGWGVPTSGITFSYGW